VLFDSWVHPLMMGLEEHLITMFREDFEFRADAAPSHLGAAAQAARPLPPELVQAADIAAAHATVWAGEAEKELGKIPFFVRGKVRRNTEKFAQERGVATITLETLYDAKAHYAR
jgi:light-independent protochlorophyllide reductase subunit B